MKNWLVMIILEFLWVVGSFALLSHLWNWLKTFRGSDGYEKQISILVLYSSTIDLNLTLPSSFLSLLLQLRSSHCHPFLNTSSVKEQHLFLKISTSRSHLRTWKWICSLLAAFPNNVENNEMKCFTFLLEKYLTYSIYKCIHWNYWFNRLIYTTVLLPANLKYAGWLFSFALVFDWSRNMLVSWNIWNTEKD